MSQYNGFCDSKSNACTAGFAVAGAVGAVEAFKDQRNIFFRDADTLVFDGQLHVLPKLWISIRIWPFSVEYLTALDIRLKITWWRRF